VDDEPRISFHAACVGGVIVDAMRVECECREPKEEGGVGRNIGLPRSSRYGRSWALIDRRRCIRVDDRLGLLEHGTVGRTDGEFDLYEDERSAAALFLLDRGDLAGMSGAITDPERTKHLHARTGEHAAPCGKRRKEQSPAGVPFRAQIRPAGVG
jgi:hypothetical protein